MYLADERSILRRYLLVILLITSIIATDQTYGQKDQSKYIIKSPSAYQDGQVVFRSISSGEHVPNTADQPEYGHIDIYPGGPLYNGIRQLIAENANNIEESGRRQSDRRSLDQNFRRGSHLSHNGLGPDVVEIHHPGGSNYQTDYNNQKYSPLRIRVRHQYPRPPSAEDSVVHQVPQTYTLHGGTAEITRYPHDDPYYRYQYLAPALVPHAYAANQEKLILTDIHQRPRLWSYQDYLNKEEGVAAKTIVEMPTSEKFLFIFLIFALTMSSILLAICLIACISNAVRVARAEEEDLPEFFPGGIDGPSAFPNGGRFGIHPPTNFNLSPQEAAKLEIQSMMMGKNGLPVSPAEAWSYATRPPIWQMEEEAEEEESEEEEEEV